MRDENEVRLTGRCGGDPEIRSTNSGARVAQFSLCTNRFWKKADGTFEEKPEWHRVVVWNKPSDRGQQLADEVEQKLRKGERVTVKGRIEYRSYESRDLDKNGKPITRYVTEIVANYVNFIDYRASREDGEGGQRGGYQNQGGGQRQQARTPARQSGSTTTDEFQDFPGALEDADDDLPF